MNKQFDLFQKMKIKEVCDNISRMTYSYINPDTKQPTVVPSKHYKDILKKIKYYEDRKAKNDEKLAQLNEDNLTLTSTLKLLKQKKEILEKMESELSDFIPSKKKDVAK